MTDQAVAPTVQESGREPDYEVIVIGAGVAGIYQIKRLVDLGVNATVLEGNADLGGTWYKNRYPGARFDSESFTYGYSFSQEVLDEWNWTALFSPQPETLKYLNFVAEAKGLPRLSRRQKVGEAIERCLLQDARERIIGKLSKGYRQRVGLAQALLGDPPILILDEPTIGLDPKQIIEIRSLIREMKGERTVILSTHILPEVEAICRRVLLIAAGQIRIDGPLDEVRGAGTLEDVFLREVRPDEPASEGAPA